MSNKGSGIGRAIAVAFAATLSFVIPASALAHHNGSGGHLLPTQQNMELVGELELDGEFSDVVPEQIADLAVYKGYAYLNSWDEPSCTRGGTYIADIRDPANPQEIGFIPAQPGYYHGEGAHVITINTLGVTRDILAVNNEPCTSNRPPGVPATAGGFDLYDVTDPTNPQTLVQLAGDQSPEGSEVQDPAELANSSHSVFVWQDGPAAYLVAVDNTELADVDIFDITDPANPVFIADFDLFELPEYGLIADRGPIGTFQGIFHHDVVVKEVAGQMRMMVSYWDGGYVQLNVDNPTAPTYITDTNFPGADPLTTFDPPEGNAHQAEYSHDNEFILAADEDFTTHRLTSEITQAPFAGVDFPSALSSAAAPITEGDTVAGDTEFVGEACGALPPRTPGVTIAVTERGTCGFAVKIDNIEAAGYDLAVIMNSSFHTASANACETLINPAATPGVSIPAVFVGRADGLRILNSHPGGSYQCTGNVGPAPAPGDTPAPPVGTQGLTIEISSEFDGWGYAHLYDAQTSEELDSFAIPEALHQGFANGFGDLSIHEFATDPETNLAYSSYYAGGVRVFQFSRANGIQQTGAYIDDEGSNFWGIEQYTPPGGGRLIAGSDRDFGLQIFRYTGPGAVQPPAGGGPPPAGGPPPGGYGETDTPQTKITDKPDKKTTKTKAKFKFTSDEANSSFECKLDKKKFKSCDSPFKKKVKVGKHKFKVRAIDPAGNVDPSPATYSWKVVKEEKK